MLQYFTVVGVLFFKFGLIALGGWGNIYGWGWSDRLEWDSWVAGIRDRFRFRFRLRLRFKVVWKWKKSSDLFGE